MYTYVFYGLRYDISVNCEPNGMFYGYVILYLERAIYIDICKYIKVAYCPCIYTILNTIISLCSPFP